jgi:twitching motility protein PilT
LLEAVSRLEGDALIMHVGEKPYVVTTSASMYAYRGPLAWGQVELSSRILTTEVVSGMLEQLLPPDQRAALAEYGAIEYALPHDETGDRFTLVAARGGEDVWLELRRTPAALETTAPLPQPVLEPIVNSEAPAASAPLPAIAEDTSVNADAAESAAPPQEPAPEQTIIEPQPMAGAVAVSSEDVVVTETAAKTHAESSPIEAPTPETAPPAVEPLAQESIASAEPTVFEIVEDEPQAVPTDAEVEELLTASAGAILIGAADVAKPAAPIAEQAPVDATPAVEPPEAMPELEQHSAALPTIEANAENQVEHAGAIQPTDQAADERATDAPAAATNAPETTPEQRPQPARPADELRHGVVLPMARPVLAPSEPPVQVKTVAGTPLERILRQAAARGAATVYVVAQLQPVIRVDGEISVLEGEPVLTAADVEGLVAELAPARDAHAATSDEWMADVPEVGRVRCVTFHDERGPGVIFRMTPPKAISADQLGIPPEVQALCAQPDGLVLVTGARASGKSTLLNGLVDLINRTRSDHIITIETQIGFVHESRRSFISQREVKAAETAAAAVRSAFREDPDVLVIDDIRVADVAAAAFEAAEAGRLVFASVAAPSTIAALDRVIEMFAVDRRGQAQTALAESLRGVVAQMLLRRVRGGRIAAREILLNTPVVAGLILEGKTGQLPVALDNGRRHGMVPLADSFAALVREGAVHAAEAYRKTPDRTALLAALRADGVDTSFAERLA